MFKFSGLIVVSALIVSVPSYAINAKYAKQLERSGCTQVTEAQGCDITKTKAENAKAGFGSASHEVSVSPYAGNWTATFPETGATVASIHIDEEDSVWVNNKKVHAKKIDGALVFKEGMVTYTIQGDRSMKGQDVWVDSDVGTKGPINVE